MRKLAAETWTDSADDQGPQGMRN